jgi:hypothetical protein
MLELEQALAFAEYQTTLNNQRTLIRQRFQDDQLLAYNGGLFKITLEFIGGLQTLGESVWAIDVNGNPIQVKDPEEFLSKAQDTWARATAAYGEAYEQLKKQRSVKALTNL